MSDEKILLVEDQETTREFVGMILSDAGYHVDQAVDGEEALARLDEEGYDLVLSDLKLGELSGIDVLKKAIALPDPPAIIIITAHGTIENAVEAIKIGAYDYLTKPVSSDELLHSIRRGIERHLLSSRIRKLESQLERDFRFDNIVAKSPRMRQVIEAVRQVAKSDATVLIEGDSGTGKELVARAIHANSRRRDQAFVAINCGAMPETLLESELFGYVKGAFTGAQETRKGLFEEAHEGSLFLDEIGETSPAFQVKLLRALQEGEIRRVGDNKPITVDVRIIAASNQDIKAMVEAGRFRTDLYYRINVIPIKLPPLRERRDDIAPLAEFMINRHAVKRPGTLPRLGHDTIALLESYPWPGNVRELENAIERALVLARSETIEPRDLPPEIQSFAANADAPLPKTALSMKDVEMQHIIRTLENTRWNQTEAARILGIGYNTLWRKLKEYNIKKPS
ncbi:MAG TPA: sigma-54 dependent transcriptional regulator [bacterium]|nr:sigma-54 dependent transcriptional regulator [bacterium]